MKELIAIKKINAHT